MFHVDNFFQNRPLSALCDVRSLCPTVGISCGNLSESETECLRAEVYSMINTKLSEAGIQTDINDTSPLLTVGINSQQVGTVDRQTAYPLFRVELAIRDWVNCPRSPELQIPVEIWRNRSTVNSLHSNASSNEIRRGIVSEVERQLSSWKSLVDLSRVTEAARSLAPRLPSIATMFDNFPLGTIDQVADLIGGQVGRNIRDPNQPEYKNTCAIRVSRSLNYSGAPIDRTVSGVRSNSGSDGKWYVYGIRDLKTYLTEKYGRPESNPANATAADFANKRGVIAYGNFHIDLWNETKAAGQAYFGDVNVRDPILFWNAPA